MRLYGASSELYMTRTYETKLVVPITKFPTTAKSHLKDINKSYVTAYEMIIHKQISRYISDTHYLLYSFTGMILYDMEERERSVSSVADFMCDHMLVPKIHNSTKIPFD